MPVPIKDWKWFGHAAHLCVGQWCRFHLATVVGKYLVSTVGEYVPDETVRQIHCDVRGIELVGRGDARLADYMNKVGFQEIGCGRKYETMVFRAGKPCASQECGCGLPELVGSDLDSEGYSDAGSAMKGQYALCVKFGEK